MAKRASTTKLDHENWDAEEAPEDAGTFSPAATHVLKKRVILKAQRRGKATTSGQNEAPAEAPRIFKNIKLTGVSSAPSSFSFLNKDVSPSTKTEGVVSKPQPQPSFVFSSTAGNNNPSEPKQDSAGSKSEVVAEQSKMPEATTAVQSVGSITAPVASLSSADTTVASMQPTTKDDVPDTGQFNFASSGKTIGTSAEQINKSSSSESTSKELSSSNNFIDKDKYYLMLHGLNKSVANWIKDNVDKNPHCILTPIFSDYVTYLNDIKSKYGKVKVSASVSEAASSSAALVNGKQNDEVTNFLLPMPNVFRSGDKPHLATAFSLPMFTTQKPSTKPEQTSLSTPAADKTAESTTADKSEDNNEDEESPEPAPAPVVEEGAVYSKRCKVFIKKAGSYQERGVGTAFIKPVVDNTKTQLIVRADTVLGNVLLNTLITASLPIQRLGPNNVMVVCVPTPDDKPPPATVLLRVKTAADADELYDKLISYKK